MKKGQMILCFMVVMAAAKTNAESVLPETRVACSVQVISDICGSGNVSIEFYQGNFLLNHGDVHCWFGDFKISGQFLSPRPDHTGTAVTVDLVHSQSGGDRLVGELTYRRQRENKMPLATLVTKNLELLGGRSRVYHLQCKEPLLLDYCEDCDAEGEKPQQYQKKEGPFSFGNNDFCSKDCSDICDFDPWFCTVCRRICN